ncbi:TetR/AcrR family transcriptional regulator [Lacticaseibacillus pabuli]|uniref:TetR/AcrR family transcriptional regulator n=1 Tax=Lacticaseibacillus pabuli TaxID=3025672 RepID=A0ABY7WSV9_9LACO|nr:TetR/AcrR family transcriptional regulator [Lacticaseibacillus sp. KACC 23028]WDF83265.1 TetR/AcrR family transcriptional regulator [Lacticaseibacillus sp. KACC 23028]
MRTIDESKKKLVIQTVLELVQSDGIQGLTFGKIAKQAGVSSGTPYVYFDDKIDMLSKIYVTVKEQMDVGLAAEVEQGTTIQDKLFLAALHFARMFLAHPLETNYMNEISANPQAVSPAAIARGRDLAAPMRQLYQEAAAAGVIVTDRAEYIDALLFAPFMTMLANRRANGEAVTLPELTALINLSLAGLTK